MAPLYPPRDAALSDYRHELRALPTRLLLEQQEAYGWQLAEISTEFGVAWREESTAFLQFKLDEIERELERRRQLRSHPDAPPWPADPGSDRALWDLVKERLDLRGVIEQLGGVRFRGSGPVLTCSCPFPWHDDSTPSFTLYPDQHWRCYGCQLGGSVIDFAAAWHNLSPHEAVNLLVELTGLQPTSRGSRPRAAKKQRIIRRDGRTVTGG